MKYDWSKEKIENAVKESDSYSEVLRKMGIPTLGNNSKTLKDKILQYNIDISHFTFKKLYKGIADGRYVSASEYLNNSKSIKTSKLKIKLIKEGLKENKCEICGITEWQGKPLVCLLHHINGDNTDNRIENLQMLCPNCHSQTENYCGSANANKEHYYCKDCGTEITKEATYCVKCNAKHRRKVNNRPNKEELISLYKKYKSFVAIGNLYEVSDRAIAKWYAAEGLPSKVSELKKYLLNLDTN